jgi:hypothetical protein
VSAAFEEQNRNDADSSPRGGMNEMETPLEALTKPRF